MDGLAVVLAAVRHLEKFTYHGGGSTVSETSSYQAKRVLEAVVTYAAHSLEELSLGQGYVDDDVRPCFLIDFLANHRC